LTLSTKHIFWDKNKTKQNKAKQDHSCMLKSSNDVSNSKSSSNNVSSQYSNSKTCSPSFDLIDDDDHDDGVELDEKDGLEELQTTLQGKCSCGKLGMAEEPHISKAARS